MEESLCHLVRLDVNFFCKTSLSTQHLLRVYCLKYIHKISITQKVKNCRGNAYAVIYAKKGVSINYVDMEGGGD